MAYTTKKTKKSSLLIIKYLLILIILILIILFIKKLLKTHHHIEYKISNYNIIEDYKYKNNTHTYNYIITNKNNKYTYTINNNVHKAKKLIKDIKTIKDNNITCIIPIYKNNKIDTNIYCLYNNKQVSNYYLISINKFNNINKKASIYNINIPKSSNNITKYKSLTIYKDNINNTYIIWNYKGIYVIKNNNYKEINFLDKDLYDNIMSTTINNMYYIFDNRKVSGINTVYRYNIDKDRLKKIKLNKTLSKSSYINGTYKNYIYLTDTKSKQEYRLNIKNNKLEIVNTEDVGYTIYKNNNKQVLDKSTYFSKNQYFNIDTSYYYKDNNFYKELNNNKILLFNINKIDNYKIYNSNIIFISNGTLYKYNDKEGLVKILKSNELKYNYINIYNYIE